MDLGLVGAGAVDNPAEAGIPAKGSREGSRAPTIPGEEDSTAPKRSLPSAVGGALSEEGTTVTVVGAEVMKEAETAPKGELEASSASPVA